MSYDVTLYANGWVECVFMHYLGERKILEDNYCTVVYEIWDYLESKEN